MRDFVRRYRKGLVAAVGAALLTLNQALGAEAPTWLPVAVAVLVAAGVIALPNQRPTMGNPPDVAHLAYTTYGDHRQWKNFAGDPMPSWIALPDEQKRAWIAAVGAVVR